MHQRSYRDALVIVVMRAPKDSGFKDFRSHPTGQVSRSSSPRWGCRPVSSWCSFRSIPRAQAMMSGWSGETNSKKTTTWGEWALSNSSKYLATSGLRVQTYSLIFLCWGLIFATQELAPWCRFPRAQVWEAVDLQPLPGCFSQDLRHILSPAFL